MPTVGDIIFACRSKIPDMSPSLPAPQATGNQSVTAITVTPFGPGTEFTITMVNNYVPEIGNVVSYTAGSDPTFNGNYTVNVIYSGNQFGAFGTFHAQGYSNGGSLGG